MARHRKGPTVRTNFAVRHIELRGLSEQQFQNIQLQWDAFIKEGIDFRMLVSGAGMFDCLVQEDKADGFLRALDLPESAWDDEEQEEA